MILRIVDLILFKFMYASNYSKNLITAEEKVAELMKQRDAALIRAEKAEAELRIAQNWVDHHSQHADDLIGKNVKLREALEQYRNCVIVGGTNPAKVVLDDLE
jgi:dynactin complex subunit